MHAPIPLMCQHILIFQQVNEFVGIHGFHQVIIKGAKVTDPVGKGNEFFPVNLFPSIMAFSTGLQFLQKPFLVKVLWLKDGELLPLFYQFRYQDFFYPVGQIQKLFS